MENSFLLELTRRIDNRFNVDTSSMSMGDWLTANTHLRGKPFGFQDYPFQKAIIDDMHANMDVVKPSQVGLSEVQIRKALGFVTRNAGTTLIFTLPTEKMFKRTSTTRIRPLIEEEKAFNLETRTGEKPSRSMALYQVGSSFMHVTGATEGDATSIAADVVMNDEVDLTDQQMLALFNSRLQNSDWKISQRFSTPTFANFGIDKGFSLSDQHEYLCRCTTCNHWNTPVFRPQFLNIRGLSSDINDLADIEASHVDEMDLDGAYVCCEKCRAALDLGNATLREWVPRYASRMHHRGYRISPFSTSRLSIKYIVTQLLQYKSREYKRGWYNTVLGEAFTDGNSRLTDTDIERVRGPAPVPPLNRSKPTWLGIDMGLICHIAVGQGDSLDSMQVVEFLEVSVNDLFETVSRILKDYNVIGGSCDRFPYTPTADELWSISGGRIIPVEYRGSKQFNLILDELTDKTKYAQMNRTNLIDTVVRMIRHRNFQFSGYGNSWPLLLEHLKDMVRDENPEKEASWVKLTGNDHYFHALAFLVGGVRLQEAIMAKIDIDVRTSVLLGGSLVPQLNTSLFGTKPNFIMRRN